MRNALIFTLAFLASAVLSAHAQEKSPKTLRQQSKIDMQALMGELQQFSRQKGEMGLVWWLPAEFWRVSMAQNPISTEAQIEQVVTHLRRYVITIVVSGRPGPFGALTYKFEPDIRASIQLRDSEGTLYRPISEDNIDADTKIFLSSMSGPFAKMLGPLGRNMHFFLFPSKNINGQYIADATKEGAFTVRMGETDYSWRLPLSSVVPPKICPVDGEKMSGAWKFCPWHGTKLLSEEEWQKSREN